MVGAVPSVIHLINATLNVIKSKKLAWQERKAESFTMSRLHCGSWHVGYRPSAEYGDGIRAVAVNRSSRKR
jgi:hypothetical protein